MSDFKFDEMVLLKFTNGGNRDYWFSARYSHEDKAYIYCVGGICHPKSCTLIIKYEGNEHLLGTKNDYVPKWEPKQDEFVCVQNLSGRMVPRRFHAVEETYGTTLYRCDDGVYQKVFPLEGNYEIVDGHVMYKAQQNGTA